MRAPPTSFSNRGHDSGGAAVVSIGFATRDLLESLVTGVLIIFDKTFQIGDRVSFGGEYGDIISIGPRSVKLRLNNCSQIHYTQDPQLTKPLRLATTRREYVHVASNAASMPHTVVTNRKDFSFESDRYFCVAI